MKWNVLKDSDGNAISAGFTEFAKKTGETVDSYDEPQDDIVAELKAKAAEPTDCCAALYALDPSLESGSLKIVIEFLQERHGGL